MSCFFFHTWKYGDVRQVDFQRQRTLMGETIGIPVKFVEERQYRTCEVCGATQDRILREY